MATTQTKQHTPSVDSLFERTGEAQEQFYTAARKAGNAYLDSYEKAVDRTLEMQLKLADASRQEWVKGIVEAQAEVARDWTKTYTSTARTLIHS